MRIALWNTVIAPDTGFVGDLNNIVLVFSINLVASLSESVIQRFVRLSIALLIEAVEQQTELVRVRTNLNQLLIWTKTEEKRWFQLSELPRNTKYTVAVEDQVELTQ